ncbi:MAG: aldo/keto reductase [Oscillospiraceae bacterium]|nr:aldo/keto reductase [Oscillospiraceae bacterium]
MNYRTDKYGNELSILGFGCLRFPQKKGKIDMAETEREILQSIEKGVNYFDTAYVYSGSEAALGEILHRNKVREKVYVATKLPHYLIKSRAGLDKLFAEELKRLKTDYVDYYLMHMLTDTATWEKLKSLGIEEWIAEKKASGQIRQIGFSYHGNSEMFCRLVDAYDWDFCQIQYNYMDEHTQAGRKGLDYAHAKGLPIIIMEPLRGGKLVTMLPEQAKKVFGEYSVQRTPAEWAFRWLWNQEEVTVVLSGMNSDAMVRENIATASTAKVGELTEEDNAMLGRVVEAINASLKVGCTACGYCQPCPKGVDIPGTFACYNRIYTEGKGAAVKEYLKCTAFRKDSTAASKCIGCGKCEKHCPQNIEIRKYLKEAEKELETPFYRLFRKAIELVKAF